MPNKRKREEESDLSLHERISNLSIPEIASIFDEKKEAHRIASATLVKYLERINDLYEFLKEKELNKNVFT